MSNATFEQTSISKSIAQSAIPRFIFGPVGLLAILCLALAWPMDYWGLKVLWTLTAAYCLFCWTSCFHEAAHHTLCGSKQFSIVVGRFLGTMIFVPFHVYRESHIRHHAYLNKSSDWELWPYSDPKTSLWFRRIFCWLEIPFGVITSPCVYGRLYFHKDSPLTNPEIRKKIRNEYIAIVVFWTAAFAVVAYTNTWVIFLTAWVVPHILAGIFQTFRKFTEHLGMESYDPLLGTRTVIGNGPITRLATYLNFDIFVHGPHHRHPRYRHDALCNRMAEYQTENPELKYPVFPTYWHAIADLLPSLIFNPGVGMNVGAPTPAEEKPHDVSDFSEDVTAEILNKDDAIVYADEEQTDEEPADKIQSASQVSQNHSQLDTATNH
ncbi:fatty acid desaturase family protein [Thalassoglobus polymorphus]|uniref:Fatty acid desaturase n=1 Tax=Thalassoglobus polymorphus TaxID=2527994 RepID=A0A517QQF9_9PLAN|nr:fatty acid desaturase [Thalassoglobus polymorphus]QDT33857.1 Fatty acid desaturase [Thalassoglobus polymorphus]